MSLETLTALQASGKTLEQDERGIKVTLLPDGNILKVFRLRRLLSSGLIYSMAYRFCRNAKRLQKLGIATVEVIEVAQIKNCHLKTVKYVPLAGKTVREMLKTGEFNEIMAIALGEFMAELHQKGIYFRSLHCGNIVKTTQGFGLIDIADLKIYPWTLWQSTRKRNFNRLWRYQEDLEQLNKFGGQQAIMQACLVKKN